MTVSDWNRCLNCYATRKDYFAYDIQRQKLESGYVTRIDTSREKAGSAVLYSMSRATRRGELKVSDMLAGRLERVAEGLGAES